MKTDSELRVDGYRALEGALGTVEAERFITLIIREPFDYTRWRKNLWRDRTAEEISRAAMQHRQGVASS